MFPPDLFNMYLTELQLNMLLNLINMFKLLKFLLNLLFNNLLFNNLLFNNLLFNNLLFNNLNPF